MRRRLLLRGAGAAAAGAAGAGLARHAIAQASASAAAPRVVPVVARRFVFIPNEVTLKKGEPVVLEFTAPEVVMGFFAPALGLRAVIVPGTPARVPFTPDRAGRFDFLCDIFCGDGHEGMSGRLVVLD